MTDIKVGSLIRVTHHVKGNGPTLPYDRQWEGEVTAQWSQYVTLRRDGVEHNVRVEEDRDHRPEVTVEVLRPAPLEPGYYIVRLPDDVRHGELFIRYWDGRHWNLTRTDATRTFVPFNSYVVIERIVQP
jgi:hypothetical protein